MFYRKTNNPVPDIMLSLGDDIKTAAEINNRTVRNFLCIHCKKGNDAVLMERIIFGTKYQLCSTAAECINLSILSLQISSINCHTEFSGHQVSLMNMQAVDSLKKRTEPHHSENSVDKAATLYRRLGKA